MAQLLKGKPAADALDVRTSEKVRALREKGCVPTLAIVRVGERQDDLSYERGATKRCSKNDVEVRKIVFPEDVSQAELVHTLRNLSEDPSVHGILLFRPLPKSLDENEACAAISPAKDVDGITAGSMAAVYSGTGDGFAPCTAQAVIEMLRYYGIEMEGKRATVVGRSLVIGKPVTMLLMAQNATVTVCHSRTADLPSVTREADIVIAALGRAQMLDGKYFHEGQSVIDVGINWDEREQKLVGDVKASDAGEIVENLSPVPGGVGSVTTAVLVSHVVQAAEHAFRHNTR